MNSRRCVLCFLSVFLVFAILGMTVVCAQEEKSSGEAAVVETTETTVEPAAEIAAESPTEPATEPAAETEIVEIPPTEKGLPDFSVLGPKNKAFEEKFLQWKSFVQEMWKLKSEYQTATPQRQDEIQKTYTEKLKTGESLQKEVFQQALAAFDEAPNQNINVDTLLFGLLEWEFNRDNYEKCYTISSKLIAAGLPEGLQNVDYIYALGGVAALMTMNLDKAEEWLKTASEKDILVKFLANHDEMGSKAQMIQRIGDYKKSWAIEQTVRKNQAEKADDQQNPKVLLKTDKGEMTLELFEDDAPNTVASFISLVEKGFYTDVIFHRVLEGFMAQGGDPTGTGSGGPGYVFDCECYKPDIRKHFRGSISMANAGPNTNGSQFFLTFVPTTMLDGRHTVFGRITDGLDVLAEIQRVNPEEKDTVALYPPTKILEAKVLSKRDHEYKPVTKPDVRR